MPSMVAYTDNDIIEGSKYFSVMLMGEEATKRETRNAKRDKKVGVQNFEPPKKKNGAKEELVEVGNK